MDCPACVVNQALIAVPSERDRAGVGMGQITSARALALQTLQFILEE